MKDRWEVEVAQFVGIRMIAPATSRANSRFFMESHLAALARAALELDRVLATHGLRLERFDVKDFPDAD